MEYRQLGKTGLKVSSLSLGTVELGLEYGIKKAGQLNQPGRENAMRIIHRAVDLGINLFDTAPNYGTSEKLLGDAVGHIQKCIIATKVSVPQNNGTALTGTVMRDTMNDSIDKSLRMLQRETLDIVQIHNATEEMINEGEVTEILLKARQSGKIRFLGASVYGEAAARAVIEQGSYDVLQVAYSLLDQRMGKNILPLARASETGIMNRSALLKGVLTARAQFLPDELQALRYATERIIERFSTSWERLPETALKFCLSSGLAHSVLVGVNSSEELEDAVRAASDTMFTEDMLSIAEDLALDEEALVNPANWSIG